MKLHHDAVSAVSCIASGQRVFVHGAAATPSILIDGLVARAPDLRDVELIHLHTFGPAPYAAPTCSSERTFAPRWTSTGSTICPAF